MFDLHRSEWEIEEQEAISRMNPDELDRLVATGKIREIDRERVRLFSARLSILPSAPYDPERVVEKAAIGPHFNGPDFNWAIVVIGK